MARTNFGSVDAYIASQPETVQTALRLVRSTLREALPLAEEAISYQIPTFRMNGSPVIYFAGYERHYALYPVTEALRKALGDELTPHLSGKATLRFRLSEPVPVDLIRRIAGCLTA